MNRSSWPVRSLNRNWRLQNNLERAGFVNRGGKGSHRNFIHPRGLRVLLSGNPGDDARHYQERDVRRALGTVQAEENL